MLLRHESKFSVLSIVPRRPSAVFPLRKPQTIAFACSSHFVRYSRNSSETRNSVIACTNPLLEYEQSLSLSDRSSFFSRIAQLVGQLHKHFLSESDKGRAPWLLRRQIFGKLGLLSVFRMNWDGLLVIFGITLSETLLLSFFQASCMGSTCARPSGALQPLATNAFPAFLIKWAKSDKCKWRAAPTGWQALHRVPMASPAWKHD